MTNSLHFSEWRNYIRAQRKVNLCAPGAPKGPKVGMFVRQYEIVCANDAGRAPRKYPVDWSVFLPVYASHVRPPLNMCVYLITPTCGCLSRSNVSP